MSQSGFGAYLRLLRVPGAVALAGWGVVGRFPIAMRALSCLLLIAAVTGSLGSAGLVAAAMLIAQGLVSPVLGRLADRYGQRRVLTTAGLLHVVGIASLLVSVLSRAPLGLLVVLAAATGCTTVSFTSFMRARWAALVESDLLGTAYALESVLDETIYLLAPLLVTVLAAALHPAAGLVACAVCTLTGSLAVAAQRRSEPAVHAPVSGRRPGRALAVPGVRVLTACYAGIGFLLGAVDVTLIAFAREHGAPGLAGVFVALTAVGSLTGGLVYGAVRWRPSQARLLCGTVGVLTLGVLPLAFAGSLLVLGMLAVLAGVAIAPSLIAGSTLLESLAPQGSLSEGFSWLSSAGATGIALGTGAGGRLADLGGFGLAALAAVGGGVVACTLTVAGRSALRGIETAPVQRRKSPSGAENTVRTGPPSEDNA